MIGFKYVPANMAQQGDFDGRVHAGNVSLPVTLAKSCFDHTSRYQSLVGRIKPFRSDNCIELSALNSLPEAISVPRNEDKCLSLLVDLSTSGPTYPTR